MLFKKLLKSCFNYKDDEVELEKDRLKALYDAHNAEYTPERLGAAFEKYVKLQKEYEKSRLREGK